MIHLPEDCQIQLVEPVNAELAGLFYSQANEKQRRAVLWDVGSNESAFTQYVAQAQISTAAYVNNAPCAIAWGNLLLGNALDLHFFYCGKGHMKALLPAIAGRFFALLPTHIKKIYCLAPAHFRGVERLLSQLGFIHLETYRVQVLGREQDCRLYLKEL